VFVTRWVSKEGGLGQQSAGSGEDGEKMLTDD
jgi:hypothetical protein